MLIPNLDCEWVCGNENCNKKILASASNVFNYGLTIFKCPDCGSEMNFIKFKCDNGFNGPDKP